MRIAVVGGSLQGTEAVYLARKAGWETLLIDQTRGVPAEGLCDRFLAIDVTRERSAARALSNVDLIIPAFEDAAALAALDRVADRAGIPLTFDSQAYTISSSKKLTNQLLAQLRLPMPEPWPGCGFPVIAKPDISSGSKGVSILNGTEEFKRQFPAEKIAEDWLLQGFVPGPSFSLEVIGGPEHYITPQVTDLFMDENYDCKRVMAPSALSRNLSRQLSDISVKIAEYLRLRGIMDVEVVLHDGKFSILEIDARLPSQTPIAVFWSTGINMLELLKSLFLDQAMLQTTAFQTPRSVIFEHVEVFDGRLRVCGEHIMSKTWPLRVVPDFFGTDEALTNYRSGRDRWQATMIYTGRDSREVYEKRAAAILEICNHFACDVFVDADPPAFKKRTEAAA